MPKYNNAMADYKPLNLENSRNYGLYGQFETPKSIAMAAIKRER